MGKNTKKNKREREQFTLMGLAARRDGETLPNFNPDWAAERGRIEGNEPPENDEFDANGALIVSVDDDLEVTDVPTSQLPPQRGYRTKDTDKDRFFAWYLQQELSKPGRKLDQIARDEIRHVRTHAELDSMVEKLLELSSGTEEILIAIDTEGSVPRNRS